MVKSVIKYSQIPRKGLFLSGGRITEKRKMVEADDR